MADLIAELEGVVAMIDIRRTDGRLRYSYPPDDLAPAAARFFAHHHEAIAENARDAARYRWLRSMDGSCSARAHVSFNIGFDWDEAHGDRLDAAIDSAMRAGEGE